MVESFPCGGASPFWFSRPIIFQLQKSVGRCFVHPHQQNLPSVETRISKDCCQRDRRCVAFLRNLLMASASAVQIKRWGSSPTPALERSPSQLGLLGVARHCTFERKFSSTTTELKLFRLQLLNYNENMLPPYHPLIETPKANTLK